MGSTLSQLGGVMGCLPFLIIGRLQPGSARPSHARQRHARGALLRIEAVASSPPTFAKLGYASGTFDVRYHETLDFFRITGALRCKANNFFGYDFN